MHLDVGSLYKEVILKFGVTKYYLEILHYHIIVTNAKYDMTIAKLTYNMIIIIAISYVAS